MLTLRLAKRDLMALVRGSSPSYAAMVHPLVRPHYAYHDHPQSEEWCDLEKLTEAELWTLYLVVRNDQS